MSWSNQDTLIIKTPNIWYNTDILVSFDLDSTLVTTKGKNKFPKDVDDWKWLYPIIPEMLHRLSYIGEFNVAIITNQMNSDYDSDKGRLQMDRIDNILANMGMKDRVLVLIATKDDIHRKPRTGTWNYIQKRVTPGLNSTPNTKRSWYIGDAAGREMTSQIRIENMLLI